MSQAAPTKEEFAKAMQAIGVTRPVIPADADMSAMATEEPVIEAEEPGTPGQAAEAQSTETIEPAETTADPKVDEKQRRSWQSEADKAKRLAYEKAQEAEAKARELEIERQKNQALMTMLAGMQQLKGEEQPKKAKSKTDKEPELWDYIPRDSYDKDDALDPSTASGQAWLKYNRALQRYEAAQAVLQQQALQQEQQAREITLKQAKALAQEFPEFRNVLTGDADLVKIQEWLDGLGRLDWVTLKRALDGKQQPQANGNAPLSAEAEISRRANKPSTVASQSAASPAKQRVPDEVAEYQKIFGNAPWVPPSR